MKEKMEKQQNKVSSELAPDSAEALKIKVFSMIQSTEEGKGSYNALFLNNNFF